jgi:hypothetical protein
MTPSYAEFYDLERQSHSFGSRLVRQLRTESLLIGLAAGVLGVGLACIFLRILPHLDPGNIPRLNEASLDTNRSGRVDTHSRLPI